MQVRKFEAPTMQEALKIVKQELGPDAIILSTKNNRKGFGLLSKASVEITAAVSDKNLTKKTITERVVADDVKNQIRNLPADRQAKVYDGFSDFYENKSAKMKERASTSEDQRRRQPQRYAEMDVIEERADNAPAYGRNGKLSALVAANETATSTSRTVSTSSAASSVNMRSEIAATAAMAAAAAATESQDVLNLKDEVKKLKTIIEEVKSEQMSLHDSRIVESSAEAITQEFNNLLLSGIERKYASQLMKQVSFNLSAQERNNSERITESLATEMMENIRVDNLLDIKPGSEQRSYIFVGPTGVGKTTTVAKIASQAVLNKNLRVGLINLDHYRVGASDQLATYAKILNIPFRQASNEAELERALHEFSPMDLILIDTTGRSQKDSENLQSLKTLLSSVKNSKTLLVLSATTRDQEIYDSLSRFKIFSTSHLVFSKLDECTVYGCIYNAAVKTGLPLAYFTVGQRVPEDIEQASRERVIDLILDL